VIDLSTDDGRRQARSLARAADVIVTSGSPSRIATWGLDWHSLAPDAPQLVHCAITGWGAKGPYRELPGYEGLVAAAAGRMASYDVQLRRGRPVFAALPVATHIASQSAVHGIVAALISRIKTGVGQPVEASLLQAHFPFDLMDLLTRQVDDEYIPLRTRAPMPTLNYHPLRCADGTWIQCGNLLEHLFYSFLDAIGLLGELLADERFQGSPAEWTPESIEEVRDRMLTRMQEKPAADWMRVFAENGNVAAEPIVTAQSAIEHPDLVLGDALVMVDDPVVGATTQIGPIAKLTATPAIVDRAAPLVDTSTFEPTARHFAAVTKPAATAAAGRPLAGVTIIDLSAIIAGPLGVSMLADLGARVIKVEPFGGDPFRGQKILHQLVADADVVVHNFREGVPDKLGLDWPTLKAINPKLIWAVVNGYGPDGPSAKRPATHPVMGASTGSVAYQAGDALTRDCSTLDDVRETSRELMAANDANPDPNTSVVAASAILLALLGRDRHGVGQKVLVNMQVANAWANSDDFLRYDNKPDRLAVDADRLGLGATYRLYPAASGWVFLAAPTDEQFASFCVEAGRPDLADDDRFSSAAARSDNDDELAAELSAAFAERSANEWQHALVAKGIGCVRADGIDVGEFLLNDEAVVANGWSPTVTHTRFGTHQRWGPTVTVGGVRDSYASAPLAGEHTDELLRELGYDDAAIAQLRLDKIVNSEPVDAL